MKLPHVPAMPLLLRLLLPLTLLVLGDGLTRSWLLWQEAVQQSQQHTTTFVDDFNRLYGPRMAELSSQGKGAELQALLNQEVSEYPPLNFIQWQSAAGQTVQAQAAPVALQAPGWIQRLQQVERLPNTLHDRRFNAPVLYRSMPAGTLTLGLTSVPEINRIWLSLRQQLWIVAGMLLAMLVLIPLAVLSSLRGLTQLSRASAQLPVKPDLRIHPTGAREVRQLASAFNAMATALQRARAVAKAQLEKTTQLANHDALTGLPNRTLLADRLRQALHRCERHHEILGLCFIDLDNFKPINDQHGHSCGDEVLVTAARRMLSELRDTDTLARVGGDEFVMLLTSLKSAPETLIVVERVMASLRQPIELPSGLVVRISGSAGVTTQVPVNAASGGALLDADLLMRQADQAMYQAKQNGRNQIQVWETSQGVAPAPQQQWVERLTQAVHAGELRLHYQPKVHIRTGRLVGLEALVRWQHPTRGLLMPGEFLPFVENSPAIVLLGQWVLGEALRQLDQWQQAKIGWPVSVNIAAGQFVRPEFLDELTAALKHHPTVPTKWLTLEILETSSLEDLSLVRAKVDAVQAMGVHCSLDDFGTGYSSLSYLKQLPVHEIKIDQSFVRGMLDDNGDLALVEGIITLSKVFSRRLVAEGVETPEHGVMLHRMGCSVAQGWAIAKAMPAEQVANWEKQYAPDPMWAMWSKSRWDLTHFPLMVAVRDHTLWFEQLMLALNGEATNLGTDSEHSYRNSRFGSWYQHLGDQHYGHIAGFHEIDQLHRKLHQLAAEVVRLCQSGEFERAKPIGDELRKQSPRLTRGIQLLQHRVLTSPVAVDTNF